MHHFYRIDYEKEFWVVSKSGFRLNLLPWLSPDRWQERRGATDQRQPGADLIDRGDARRVSQLAEQCRAQTAQSEGEAKKQTGDGAGFAGDEFLGIDQDRREG